MTAEAPSDFSLAEALSPFSAQETARLSRYVELCEELKQSRFFAQESQRLKISFSQETGMTYEIPYGEDEEIVTVMVTRLRKLHAEGKRGAASFKRIVRMLRNHTEGKGGTSAEWLRELLDSHERRVEQILTSSLIGLVKERVDDQGNVVSESLPPEQVFLDWVYAIYLHDDEDRLARLADWDPIPVHRFNFLQMAGDLSRAYYGFSGIPREVLTEPTLLPADTSAA